MKTIPTASLTLLLAAAAMPAMAQSGPYNWSGGYVGVYGGYLDNHDLEGERLLFDRDLDGNFDDVVRTGAGVDAFNPGSCPGQPNSVAAPAGCSDDQDGVEGGIRAGYDFQFGNFVLGGLAEFSATDSEDSVTSFSTTPASYSFTRTLRYLAAARLRLGYAVGPALLYGTGGYASGEIGNRYVTSNNANSFTSSGEDDDNASGWQGGGGIEYALAPNLSVTGEYLYTNLDTDPEDFIVRIGRGVAPATNPFILPPNSTGTDHIRSHDQFRIHAFRIGMNYRF